MNSNLGHITHCLATIARDGLQGHPSHLTERIALPVSD